MKTISGALLLFLFCVCEAGTDHHFDCLSIEQQCHQNSEEHENPQPENPGPVGNTTPEPHAGYGPYPIKLLVMNSIGHTPNNTYGIEVAYRGVLIGAMRRIEKAYSNFTFTYHENSDYGPYLQSVNGLNGTDHTYWQVLGTTEDGTIKPTILGIGCYIPKRNEQVYLKYTSY